VTKIEVVISSLEVYQRLTQVSPFLLYLSTKFCLPYNWAKADYEEQEIMNELLTNRQLIKGLAIPAIMEHWSFLLTCSMNIDVIIVYIPERLDVNKNVEGN